MLRIVELSICCRRGLVGAGELIDEASERVVGSSSTKPGNPKQDGERRARMAKQEEEEEEDEDPSVQRSESYDVSSSPRIRYQDSVHPQRARLGTSPATVDQPSPGGGATGAAERALSATPSPVAPKSSRERDRGSSAPPGRGSRQRAPTGDFKAQRIVLQLRDLAARLEGPASKYPKFQSMGRARERFLAILPYDEIASELSFRQEDDDWKRELKMWRRGKLAYWPAQENYARQDEPKGWVDLMAISKIEWAATTPCDVSVRHKESGAAFELLLQFASEDLAVKWRGDMHSLRTLLQQTVMHM